MRINRHRQNNINCFHFRDTTGLHIHFSGSPRKMKPPKDRKMISIDHHCPEFNNINYNTLRFPKYKQSCKKNLFFIEIPGFLSILSKKRTQKHPKDSEKEGRSMAIKTNRPSPTEQLKQSKTVRVFNVKCTACAWHEFVTLFDGELPADSAAPRLGRAVTQLPSRCPLCGAAVTAVEFPLFVKPQ